MLQILTRLLPLAVGIRWRVVGRWGVSVAFVLLLIYCYLQHVSLAQNQLVYRNPAVIKQTRIVRVEGPVRIVTRVVETPGRIERETIEEHGQVSEVHESATVSVPVFPPAPRSDRWLAGISANPFHYRESRSWGAYAGYGFRNRLDVMAGYSDGSPKAIVVLRF